MTRNRNGFEFLPEDTLKRKRLELKAQLQEVAGCGQLITCTCGMVIPLRVAYRCFYCGQWFCHTCAKEHFAEHDLECVELRQHRYGRIAMICRMPSLKYALTFMEAVDENYWDEEDAHKMLFPAIAHIDLEKPDERTTAVILKDSKALDSEAVN